MLMMTPDALLLLLFLLQLLVPVLVPVLMLVALLLLCTTNSIKASSKLIFNWLLIWGGPTWQRQRLRCQQSTCSIEHILPGQDTARATQCDYPTLFRTHTTAARSRGRSSSSSSIAQDTRTSLMASVQRAPVGCLLHFIGFYAFYFMLMFLLLNFPEFSFTFFCVSLHFCLSLQHWPPRPPPTFRLLLLLFLLLPAAADDSSSFSHFSFNLSHFANWVSLSLDVLPRSALFLLNLHFHTADLSRHSPDTNCAIILHPLAPPRLVFHN